MKKIYDENGNLFAELNYSKKYFLNYSKHSHETFALSIIGSGELEIEFHSKPTQILSPKQIVIFNPNIAHRTKRKSKDIEDYYTLHLEVSLCRKIQCQKFKSNDDFISLENIIDNKNIYEKLLRNFEKINFENKRVISNELIETIECILREYTVLENKEDINEHMILSEVEKYITTNLHTQISLEDISSSIGYTESYITRVFKEKYGLTPHAYLINKRVEKARKKLIKNKNINLAQLSSEVGFYDQSHFNKVFKRVFAKTPNKYKMEE